MAKFCTNCGTSLADAAKFCNKCGTKQDAATPVQPQPAPPVQQAQPQYQQPYAPKKKKSKLPIILSIVGVVMVAVIVGVVLLINSVLGILSNTAKADYYEMGKDRIPSVKYFLGEERKVTGVNTSANGKATSREIIYGVPGSERRDELYQYYKYLVEDDGFYNLTEIDFNSENSGVVVVGRNSVESGYEIQMQLKYDTGGYTVTILKQPGGITPYETETENSDPLDNNQTPEPNNSGASGAGNNQTPDPNNNKTPGNGDLTKDIFDIMNGGTYHIKMRVLSGEDDGVMEIYAKNGMTSMLMSVEDTDMRVVVKDGKSYIVMDDYQMVIVQDADPDGETEYLGDTENMTYIGEGSGEFYGSIYRYDEYRNDDGVQYFYYVDGGELKGIRTVSDGDTVDVVILALDKNVPDYVFDIPSDYEVVEY